MKGFKLFCTFLCLVGLCFSQENETHELDKSIEKEQEETAANKTEEGEFFSEPPTYSYEERKFKSDYKNAYKGRKYEYDREQKQKEPLIKTDLSIPPLFFKISMYLILGAIVILIVYQILRNMGGVSYGRKKQKIRISSKTSQREDKENIENNDFQLLIEKAKNEENHRKAIRYYYLWVLQKLTEKNYIKWNKEKTNYDYYLELKAKSIQNDFSQVNYLYDYIWYGNFGLTAAEFKKAETVFQKTINKIK